MISKAHTYREAGLRAIGYLLAFQRPDGAFTGEDFAEDVFHKLPYSLNISGFTPEAHHLANWIASQRLAASGHVEMYRSPGPNVVYKHAWLIHGLHRLGRFDISYPLFSRLKQAQQSCGAFNFDGYDTDDARALTTCWAGVAALYLGDTVAALKAGNCMADVMEQQPDPRKWYYLITAEGKIRTEEDSVAAVIDQRQDNQYYWELGMAMILFCRLFQVTKEDKWKQLAGQAFEFNLKCKDDGFAHAASGKNGFGAALYYLISGDKRAGEAACREGDFLVRTQEKAGGWVLWDKDGSEPDTMVVRMDHAGEYNVWLHEIASVLEAMECKSVTYSN